MAMKGEPKINKLIGVYHLQYEMEQKIVEFDIDGTDASKKCDEEYTLEMHHALLKGERIIARFSCILPLCYLPLLHHGP